MSLISVIDIGSNSIRLVLVKIENNTYKIINQVKESARLGENMDKDLNIAEEKVEKAIQTLKEFKSISNSYKVEKIYAVATEAVRKSKNKQYFLYRVKMETGVDIRILTGDEEAYYDYFGVINTLEEKDALLMDIGGSSTEIIHIHDRKVMNKISIPYGCISLTKNYSDAAMDMDFNNILDSVTWLKDVRVNTLIGIGGSFRNVGKIHRKLVQYPLDAAHNYKLTPGDITQLYENIRYKTSEEMKNINGLSKERADIFKGAVAFIGKICEYCSIENIILSNAGLREGVTLKEVLKIGKPLEDVFEFSLNSVINEYKVSKIHLQKIYKLSKKLCERLNIYDEKSSDENKILKTASLMYALRTNPEFNSKNNLFDAVGCIKINGISHREIIISLLASVFDKSTLLSTDVYNFFKYIKEEDVIFSAKLLTIFNVVNFIDSVTGNALLDLECYKENDDYIVKTIVAKSFKFSIDKNASVYKDFKKLFNAELIIQK